MGEVARAAEGNAFRDVDVRVGTRPRLRLRRSKARLGPDISQPLN